MADRSSDKGREGHGASGAERDRARPGSQPVSEGIEGSILDDATEQKSQSRTGEGRGGSGGGRSTGAGSEASEGIHAAQGGRDQRQNSSVESAETGMSGSGRSATDQSPTGSEPLHGRTREHQSGYGGAADRPKTSSDQREPLGDEEAGDGL